MSTSNLNSFKKRAIDVVKRCFHPKKEIKVNSLDAKNVWDWIQKYRPNVGGDKRNFDLIPFWKEFYLDPHSRKGALCGRQVYKSTASTDLIGYVTTSGPMKSALYVVHDPTSLEAFSVERLREGTFLANPQLAPFLPHGRASVKTIKLTNHSRAYLRHGQGHYKNVEGLTAHMAIVDEIQKQNVSRIRVLKHTTRAHNAPLIMFGIGAEEGTTFHDMIMQESDIYDWKYADKSPYIDPETGKKWANQGWRHKLTFDEHGTITNTPEELSVILDGKLRKIHSATSGDGAIYKFYHFPQHIFGNIPLTISDAKYRYHTDIDQSIEYQKIHEDPDVYTAHCEGWFHKARGAPLNMDMIRKCYNESLSFLTPIQIAKLKQLHGKDLGVYAGIDWGSNREGKSNTAIVILLRFKKTQYTPAHYQIAYIKVFDTEATDAEEAPILAEIIKKYHVDHTTCDIGFGKSGVKILQQMLSYSKVKGVFTLGNLLEETHTYQMDAELDDKKFGVTNPYLKVHKTERVDHLINIVKATIPDPDDPINKRKAKPKLIIPYENPIEVEDLIDGLAKIRREDLITPIQNSEVDRRQAPEKKYQHYKDTVSALIHAFIAEENHDPAGYLPSAVRSNNARRNR